MHVFIEDQVDDTIIKIGCKPSDTINDTIREFLYYKHKRNTDGTRTPHIYDSNGYKRPTELPWRIHSSSEHYLFLYHGREWLPGKYTLASCNIQDGYTMYIEESFHPYFVPKKEVLCNNQEELVSYLMMTDEQRKSTPVPMKAYIL